MPIDCAAIESEITMWSNLYEWHGSDQANESAKALLYDAIKLAECHGLTDTQAVIMALMVEQAKLISRWSSEMLKIPRPFKFDAEVEINTAQAENKEPG